MCGRGQGRGMGSGVGLGVDGDGPHEAKHGETCGLLWSEACLEGSINAAWREGGREGGGRERGRRGASEGKGCKEVDRRVGEVGGSSRREMRSCGVQEKQSTT